MKQISKFYYFFSIGKSNREICSKNKEENPIKNGPASAVGKFQREIGSLRWRPSPHSRQQHHPPTTQAPFNSSFATRPHTISRDAPVRSTRIMLVPPGTCSIGIFSYGCVVISTPTGCPCLRNVASRGSKKRYRIKGPPKCSHRCG